MKILIVCKALPYAYQGGIQTHTWELGKCLVRYGHEVTMLTAGSLKNRYQQFELEGIHIQEVPILPKRFLPILPNFISDYSFNYFAYQWLKTHQYRFDIIHLQSRSGLFYPNKKKRQTPCVLTVHRLMNVEGQWGSQEFPNRLDFWAYHRYALKNENLAIQNANAVIGISDEVLKEIKAFLPHFDHSAIHKIYNGIAVDHIPAREQPVPHPNQLIFIGRLVAVKGLIPLIEALSHTHQRIKLLLIGEGNQKPELVQRVQQLGLQDRVVFEGQVPNNKVFDYIRSSYALILPSFHETQGIVLMEANICGRPVLGSDVPGINEMIVQGKNGLRFPVGNPIKMAEAVNYLFDHPQEAEQMGQWGRKYVAKHFSWEAITQQTIEVYQSILTEKRLSQQTVNKQQSH